MTTADVLHARLLAWYAECARELPWRDPHCSPWGVFLSEVMAQQTPLVRVEPVWRTWMERWPTPTTLAEDSPGEAVRAWGRLGYPRRALRLHAAAAAMVEHFGGEVPSTEADLRSLPGVGEYTAAAVAVFAYGQRATVVDTNIRRVQARLVTGTEHAAPSLTRAERDLAAALLPDDDEDAATWNVAVMELGALVCTARAPECGRCPVVDLCRWVEGGRPPHSGPRRRGQPWAGTDRQVRGEILQRLRESAAPLARTSLAGAGPDPDQVERCLSALVHEGLVESLPVDRFALPS